MKRLLACLPVLLLLVSFTACTAPKQGGTVTTTAVGSAQTTETASVSTTTTAEAATTVVTTNPTATTAVATTVAPTTVTVTPDATTTTTAVPTTTTKPISTTQTTVTTTTQTTTTTTAPKKIKVSCVGDSITETGYWSGNMQGLLPSDRFIVKGYGKGGTTAMSTGRWSADNAGSAAYKNHAPYTRSLSSKPDVVVIMFGINDAYSFNWDQAGNANGAQFKKDYIALIRTYQNLASHPTVIMAIPPTVYSTYANCKENLEGKVIPVLREIAAETGVTLVDVQTATAGHRDHFADGVHPSDETGRLLIATPIANAVLAHVEGE